MPAVVTRFPPSPTGHLHVGGARTALFNWLYARHTGGRFVLRMEDTDTRRSTQESVDTILDSLRWLGIQWDEGPYFQTQRFDIYRTYIEKLLHTGNAYYCTCPPEAIEEMRKTAMAAGNKPRYDGTCRARNLEKSNDAVVRFKSPTTGTMVIEDVVKGNIVFQNEEMDDFIIQRSDGTPTYNLAVVVDDITMEINTVIRGDDHIMNTPKQMLLYRALAAPLPLYAHVPMVLGNDRARLSKRHGAESVTAYREMGFLPDALINYLVRLGWSCGDQEFFTRRELIDKFSLDHIGKSAGIFDAEKLLALNADHIRAAAPEDLLFHLEPFLKEKGYPEKTSDYSSAVIRTLQPRSKTLREMAEMASFYYESDLAYDEKAARKFLTPTALAPIRSLCRKMENLNCFDESALEQAFQEVMTETGLQLGKIAQPVRVALTGKTASPGIFEVVAILGKEIVCRRLKKAMDYIGGREPA